jgi:D-inositol-3-phosphate glycosyltransferase
VIHVEAGPQAPISRERIHEHLDDFVDQVDSRRVTDGVDYDLVHGHYWLSGVAALRLRARWGVPVVQMFHTLGQLKNSVARTADDIEPELRIREETRVIAMADRLVAANTVERAHLQQYYGARFDRIGIVPCGVDTELFRPGDSGAARDELGLPAGPLLLFVGRLTPIKGLETLLDSMALLDPRPSLVVVGGDQDEPLNGRLAGLRARVAALGLDGAVQFLGPQPQPRLRLFYTAADVTVMPSYYESFGMVALEAMACGSPVIASSVGGLTTTVQDGVTGYLVADGDARTLADRIATVLGDEGLRWRLGSEAVRWAARYGWPCVAEAICREYALLQPLAESHLPSTRCH